MYSLLFQLLLQTDSVSVICTVSTSCIICAGLLRMERWKRAEKFGFSPPPKVRDLVTSHSDDDRYTKWYEALFA